jgi:hypothetical protein
VSFILALEESSTAIGVDFHGAHCSPAKELPAEDPSSDARKEREFS